MNASDARRHAASIPTGVDISPQTIEPAGSFTLFY
jgi:hypothetical protein